MSRKLVHQVLLRCRFVLCAGLFAACAPDEAALQDSGDAHGAVGVPSAGDGMARTGVTASPAAGGGARAAVDGNVAGPAAGRGASASGSVAGSGAGAVSGSVAGSGPSTVAGADAGSGAMSGAAGGGAADASSMLAAGAGGGMSASSGAPALPMAGAAAGSAGSLGAAGSAAVGGAITVWLAGDSTVAKGNTPCPVGWGAEFQALLEPEAKVVNSAVGGRSVRTWLYEVQTQMDSSGECALNKDSSGKPVLQARWQMMLDGMKMGDYLFIQFGINDSSATCDRHVGIEAFKESYGMMAEAAKMRGAQPVFVTPVSAISCSGSMARPTRGNFVTATIDAGKKYDVPVVDLHERSIALYNQQGLCPIPGGSDVSASTGGKVGAFFCDDHTHFSSKGAAEIAKLMAQAVKDQNLSLAAYLR